MDTNEFRELIALVNLSPYFEREQKRPFIFRALDENIVNIDSEEEFMEVNTMLSLIDTHFPDEAGIYKKGAKFEEKTSLLYFNFPKVASHKYKKEIVDFEQITGWKVETNSDCNLSAVQNLILKLLPEKVEVIGSVSYFRTDNLIKVKISKSIDEEVIGKLCEEFLNISGIQLEISTPDQKTQFIMPMTQKANQQMEQNQAFSLIDEEFSDKPHKLYKKSLKTVNGEMVIELSFISPEIGEKYRLLIDELEAKTRWNIKINNTPNQTEIFNIGLRIFSEKGVALKKNLSYLPIERKVRATVNNIDLSTNQTISEEFLYKTGLELMIVEKI